MKMPRDDMTADCLAYSANIYLPSFRIQREKPIVVRTHFYRIAQNFWDLLEHQGEKGKGDEVKLEGK